MRWLFPWLLAGCALAQAPEELLRQMQAKMLDNLVNQPNFTCLETVERTRQAPGGTQHVDDTIRLEVGLVDGKYIVNPSFAERKQSVIDLIVASVLVVVLDKVHMVLGNLAVLMLHHLLVTLVVLILVVEEVVVELELLDQVVLVVLVLLSFLFLRHNHQSQHIFTQHQDNGQHRQELLRLIMF